MLELLEKTPFRPSPAVQDAMADYFANCIVDDATGVADGDICEGDPPRARYYLATLAPVPAAATPDDVSQDRDANCAIGFEFEVAPETTLRLKASVSVYYKVLPTYEQQTRDRNLRQGASGRQRGAVARIPLTNVYKRVSVGPIIVEAPIGNDRLVLGAQAFAVAFSQAAAAAVADPRRFRRVTNVPISELADEAKYEAFLSSQPPDFPTPTWSAHLELLSRRSRDGRLRVTALLVNDSPQPMRQGRGGNVQDDDLDHFLFRGSLIAAATAGSIKPIALDLGPDGYRYNGNLAAYALSCGVEAPGWNERDDAIPTLVSVPAPLKRTFRVDPVDNDVIRRATDYANLAENPVPLLKEFAAELEGYANNDAVWVKSNLDDAQRACLNIDRGCALAEARRFRAGIGWLERDQRLLLAFRLANRTMLQLAEQTGKRDVNTNWHSFQLVAIISELSTLAWREFQTDQFPPGLWAENERDPNSVATIVYFPTGGGKTEAYLGMTACGIFYDRIRGKGRGITTLCRFPLKVLTLNQCERLVDFVVAADHVRCEYAVDLRAFDTYADVPFEVGLLIGSDDVPNRISEKDQFARLQQPDVLERVRVVDRCPYCRCSTVSLLPPSEPSLRLDHVCTSCDRRLPIMITDGEVYRYLPCLIVSTIDKLALIGLGQRFGILLGDVDCECDLHGLSRGLKCVEKEMCHREGGHVTPLPQPLIDATPTFEVVDELHLLTEDLGGFDGHYETALAEIQKAFSARARADRRGVRMKIVATTATIRGEDRQVAHLYGLRSVVTPTMGPDLNETFFWRRDFDKPLRLFLGIQPSHGKTAEMTAVRLLCVLHAAIQDLRRNGRACDPSFAELTDDEVSQLVHLYRRSLTYTTSLVDLNKLARSIPTQVNAYLIESGYDPARFEMLYSGSSREGIGEVRRIVDALQNDDGEIDGVIGTSSVSHGLDIPALNLMLFNGMPKSMSEYIQASSRIGRAVEGLVIIVYNPARERDRSHFRYHGKFHEYLDRMVAPVAINRWSKFAGHRTFPGILMAYILQVLNRQWWDAGHAPRHLHQLEQMQQAMNDRAITGAQIAEVKRELVRFYDADRPEATELKQWLLTTSDAVLANLRMAAPAVGGTRGGFEYHATADYLNTGFTPMISLRDVDEGCSFVWQRRN